VERTIQCTVKRKKGNWIGHSWRRNCLPQHVIEGTIEGTRRRGRKRKQLLDDLKEEIKILYFESGSTRSHPVGNSLWQRLWTCREADCGMCKARSTCSPITFAAEYRGMLVAVEMGGSTHPAARCPDKYYWIIQETEGVIRRVQ